MNKSTIQTLIDKVIGKKGLIRVPSWWMRKVLMQMADWVQEGDDANGKKINKVKEEVDSLKPSIDTLRPDIDKLIQITSPYALVSGTGYIVVNDSVEYFNNADNLRINITGRIKFSSSNSATNNITRVKLCNISYEIFGKYLNYTFSDCQNLTSINLNSFDTYAMTDMRTVFNNCSSLTSLNLSSFDTSMVTKMNSMFKGCSSLTSLDISSFDTSAVTEMPYMFGGCSSLTSLDISSFNTSSVTNMNNMFSFCSSLISLNLSNFDTLAVTDMGVMFANCSKLTSLNLSSFDTSSVTNMNNMFLNCSSIASLILGPNFFKTPTVTSIDFSYCSKWTNDTVVTSLVTNSYDRATAGLKTMTLQLSANTKAALTDEQKAAITAKGYTIA